MKEFLFDLSLAASLRVRAETEADAIRLILGSIDCNTANLGAWPNGDPILAEVSVAMDSNEICAVEAIDFEATARAAHWSESPYEIDVVRRLATVAEEVAGHMGTYVYAHSWKEACEIDGLAH